MRVKWRKVGACWGYSVSVKLFQSSRTRTLPLDLLVGHRFLVPHTLRRAIFAKLDNDKHQCNSYQDNAGVVGAFGLSTSPGMAQHALAKKAMLAMFHLMAQE